MDQITNHLWIGSIRDVQEEPTDRFDAVVSVCQDKAEDNVGCIYPHFELSDGDAVDQYGGNCTYNLFRNAVDQVRACIVSEMDTLVHCHVGQSRSVTVCAAAIAVEHELSYREARSKIADVRTIHPDQTLEEFARRYVEHNRYDN